MQTLPSERVRPNILPSHLGADSGPMQISDIPQQTHLKTQENVQEIRQGQAAESYSPSTGPGALTGSIAPMQSPSKMLQETNQEKNTINHNVTNAVPAVSKHVSFQSGHDVHDISMISVDGSPLRDRILQQNVLAMRLYTADGAEVCDIDDSAVEYAGNTIKFKNVDGHSRKRPYIQSKIAQFSQDPSSTVDPDHWEYKNRLIDKSDNSHPNSGNILVFSDTATTDTHHIARPPPACPA